MPVNITMSYNEQNQPKKPGTNRERKIIKSFHLLFRYTSVWFDRDFILIILMPNFFRLIWQRHLRDAFR